MKAFFSARSVRERVLMTAFLLVAVVIWASSLLERSRLLQLEWKDTSADIAKQLSLFKRKDQVGERTAKVTAQLDPRRTMNAAEAFAEINRLALGLPMEMGAQRSEPTENFVMHSFQVTFRRVGLEPLLRFYKELSQKAPYLGIDQCAISTDRSTPGQINAVFRIYSVEVPHSAKP